jgi:hypothetical protein
MVIELSTLVTELSRTAPSRKAARLPKISQKKWNNDSRDM